MLPVLCCCGCFDSRNRKSTQTAEKTLCGALMDDEPDIVLHLLETTEQWVILQELEGCSFASNKALRSLLRWAIKNIKLDLITVAYACCADPPDMTPVLCNPGIYWALCYQDANSLKALLKLKGDPNLSDFDADGILPSIRALQAESDSYSLALLRPLLEAMANPNQRDYSVGLTPFAYAVREGQVNIVRRMLAYPKERIYELSEILFDVDPKTFPPHIGQLVASMVSPEQPKLTLKVIAASHGAVKRLLTKYLERGSAAPWSEQNEGYTSSLFHDPLFCKCPEDPSFCQQVRSGYFDDL